MALKQAVKDQQFGAKKANAILPAHSKDGTFAGIKSLMCMFAELS